ncbi:enoyl-CoA hydratase/isomerase family protein [Candidatus Bathyarchaeota archaeon]|nr:MAG: enoyl-CoA hydratase/isomerase family protein [Candidatus Bathyarchaeota archaeon]
MGSAVLIKEEKRVAEVILNRPEVYNAMNYQLVYELEKAFLELSRKPELSAIILSGAGKAFSVGADLKYLQSIIDDLGKLEEYIIQINRAFNSVEDCPIPVIAVVHGYALAGGFELMQASDIVIATEDACIGDQHANFWLIPGGGGTQRLPSLIGLYKAKELLFTGRWLNGKEAEKMGIVSRAVPKEKLEMEVQKIVSNLLEKHPQTLRYMKQLVNYGFKANVRANLEHEFSVFLRYIQSKPAREGINAFIEKRKPKMEG